MVKLSHDYYTILDWIYCVCPGITSDIKERYVVSIHEAAVERIFVTLYARIVDATMLEIINNVWKE